MTATPSLPAQIEAISYAIARLDIESHGWKVTPPGGSIDVRILRAILVTLQQRERLEDELRGARLDRDSYEDRARQLDDECQRFIREVALLREGHERLEAEAVDPVITPEMLRAGISVAEAHFLRAHGAWRDLVVAVYRAMYLSRPSRSDETEVTIFRKDIAENTGDPR